MKLTKKRFLEDLSGYDCFTEEEQNEMIQALKLKELIEERLDSVDPNIDTVEWLECDNRTFRKLKIPLPRCKDDVHLSIGTDDWGVHFISYGNRDEMTELVNIILECKYKAEQFDKLPVKLVESPEFAIGLHTEKKNELL